MKINSELSLRHAILQIEAKQKNDWNEVRLAANQMRQSFIPLNLIKNAIQQTIHPSSWKEDTLRSLFTMVVSYLAKRSIVGNSENPVKKVFGLAVQIGLGSLLTHNPGVFETLSGLWFKFIAKKESPSKEV